MRPRYLEIEGLQSFKEAQTVDFDRLGETGLFGIFGPTGSGKSTILDAMTLALYGKVLRAGWGTQGIVNSDSNIIRVSFIFELLKSEGRKTFRVERTYKRKKDSDSAVEIKVARLLEIIDSDNLIIADKPAEVNSRIEELLGLQLDDFTRSVVLPQNKFQEFLMLDKAKKRDMMERIFYLEEYGRNLTEKVASKLSIVKFKLSGLDGAISTLGDVSEKTLIEAERKLMETRSDKDNIEVRLKLSEVKYNDAKEVWKLIEDLRFVSSKEQDQLINIDSINSKKVLYDRAVKADALTDSISKYRDTHRNLTYTQEQFEVVSKQLGEIENELGKAREKHAATIATLIKEEPALIEKRTKLNEGLSIKKELELLESELVSLRDSYKTHKSLIETRESEINTKKTELEEGQNKVNAYRKVIEAHKIDLNYKKDVQQGFYLEKELDRISKEKEAHQIICNGISSKVVDLHNQISQLGAQKQALQRELDDHKIALQRHESLKPADRNAILLEISEFHQLRNVLDSLKSKMRDLDATKTKIEQITKDIERINSEHNNAIEKFRVISVELSDARSNADRLKKKYEISGAVVLAEGLVEGQPCPVCGSINHPLPAHRLGSLEGRNIEQKLNEATGKLETLENNYRLMEIDCIRLEQQVRGHEGHLRETGAELLTRQNEYEEIENSLPEKFRKAELGKLEEELKMLEASSNESIKEIDAWESEYLKLKDNITNLEELLSKDTIEEKGKQAELKFNTENLTHQKELLRSINQSYDEIFSSYTHFKERLGVPNFHMEQIRLEESEHKSHELQKQAERLDEELKQARKIFDDLLIQKQKLSEEFAEVKTQGEIIKAKKLEKDNKLNEIAGDTDIEKALIDIELRITELRQQEKHFAQKLKEMEESFNKSKTTRSLLQNQKEIYSAALEAENGLLDRLLKEKGFQNIDEAENSLIKKEEMEKLKQDIQEFEETIRKLQTQKELILKKLDGRSITDEEWHQIEQDYQQNLLLRDESISRYEGAKNTFSNVKSSFDKWLRLNSQRQEYVRKREMLEQIQKLLKGNSFVEFICEERLRYVAKEASETLGVLSKYKYALEIDTENGFVIRDNANGGIHRMVSSLSGGEIFLTSLSLALALSSQIQLKGQSPLEFFFLDEGFGTLDSALLDTVVDSLERLSTSKRVIGLISHVPELKSRIARRLIVQPPVSGGKGSSVHIEKA